MYEQKNEIIVCNSNRSKELKDIDKAIDKLKLQEKKLVDLYLTSNLNVDAINHKNEMIKKEIQKLNNKKDALDPDNEFKEYTLELSKKLDCVKENDEYIFTNNLGFSFVWDSLNRKTKRDLIQRLIASLEIERDRNYNIEIKNIKFTGEFISKSNKEYLEYLNDILEDSEIGIKYKGQIDKKKLKKISSKYTIISLRKYENNEYSEKELNIYLELLKEHFYYDGIINCPYIENNLVVDQLLLIPKGKETIKMTMKYLKINDYVLPNLVTKNNNIKINKYGLLRLDYLKTHKKALYETLLMKEELDKHLNSISKLCEERLNILMNNYVKNDEKLSEKNKKFNQLEWVKLMNNYKNCAEEAIFKELIYV